jgi:hypothetical protein
VAVAARLWRSATYNETVTAHRCLAFLLEDDTGVTGWVRGGVRQQKGG